MICSADTLLDRLDSDFPSFFVPVVPSWFFLNYPG
jgi:hypothetical protein